jgi:hypothetical protein
MEGQAHIMGHLPRQWNAPIYFLLQKQVEAKMAADGMPAWRQKVLMRFQQQQEQQQQQQQQGFAEALMQKLDTLIQMQMQQYLQLQHLQDQQMHLQQQPQPQQQQQQPAMSCDSFHSCCDSFHSCEDGGWSAGAPCTMDTASS